MRVLLVAMVLLTFGIAFTVGSVLNSERVYIYEKEVDTPFGQRMVYEPYTFNAGEHPEMTAATVVVPAVDQNGKGVSTLLNVQVVPGSGQALVNIDKLLFWVDTQNSIRTARDVAEQVMGIDLSKSDIVYSIVANASIIEGPSAGAALTVATIAALRNQTVDESVMLTGTINPDGTIGPVGGVLEKARAAKSIGAETFLVPETQSVDVKVETRRVCEDMGFANYCTIENIPIRTDIEEATGIVIIEVKDIVAALEYFMEDYYENE